MLNDHLKLLLSERFPPVEPAIAQENWHALKQRLGVGQSVTGTVVAKSPFGAWLDIGVGFPALLLIPDVKGLTPGSYQNDQWCPIGRSITAEVLIFNDLEHVVRVAHGTLGEATHSIVRPSPHGHAMTSTAEWLSRDERGRTAPPIEPRRYPPPTRSRAGFAILIGLVGLWVHHWMMSNLDHYWPWLMIILPVVFFQGLGGLIDPRLLYAFSEEGRNYPKWVKNVGGILILVGVAAGAAIAHFVYGFWR